MWTYIDDGVDYDPNWMEVVEAIKNRWVPGKPLPNVTTGKLVRFQGHLFVADIMLRKFGYLDIEDDSVILIDGKYYEVNGKVHDGKTEGWWIEEVQGDLDNLPVLSEAEYEGLERKRCR
jgi:hypothetical protein